MEINSRLFPFQPLALPVPQTDFFEIFILKRLKLLNLILQGLWSFNSCFCVVSIVLERKLAMQTVPPIDQIILLDHVYSE